MKNARNAQTVYHSILNTYVLLSLVILLIGGLICSALMINNSWLALDSSGQASLNQARTSVDAQIRMLSNIGQIMKTDSSISLAAVASSPQDYSLFLKMQEYSYLLDILQDVLLCYDSPQTDPYIYSPKGIYRKEFFDKSYDGHCLQNSYIDDWMQHISRPTWEISEDISGNPTIVYIYPLTMGKGCISRAAFFVLKADKLFQMLSEGFEDELLSASASIIGGKTLLYQRGVCSIIEEPEVYTYTAFSNNSEMVFRIHSKQSYQLFPIRILYLIIAFLGICLVGTITVLIVKLARRTSQPISQLAHDLANGKHSENSLYGYEELDSIQNAYHRIHQENKRISGDYHRQSQLLRSNLLLNMIHGKLEDVNADYLHSAMGLQEEHNIYRLVMVMLDKSEQEADTERIIEHFIALSSSKLSVATTNIMVSGFAIILLAGEEAFSHSDLSQLLKNVQEQIRETCGTTVTLVLSPSFENLEDVRGLFHDMRDVAQYRVIMGTSSIIDMTHLPETEQQSDVLGSEISELVSLCEIPDMESAQKQLNSILNQHCNRPDLINLRSTCYMILSSMRTLCQQILYPNYADLNGFSEPDTLAEAKEELSAQIIHICSTIKASKEDLHVSLCNHVVEYMETHYTDPNLTPAMLAEEFNVSQGYLFRIFKNQRGTYLAAMLDQIRMKEVRRLLSETDIPVKDIVTKVGYVDVSNFIRKFKRQEGETPLSYRKRLRNSGVEEESLSE